MAFASEAENYIIFCTFLMSGALQRLQAVVPVAFLPSHIVLEAEQRM